MDNNNKSSTGLPENIAGLLCYAVGWVTGIIFIFIEKESRFVRFHAIQSTVVFVALFVANLIVDIIPFIGGVISALIGILAFVIWIFMMYKAYQGEMYKLPVAGDFTETKL